MLLDLFLPLLTFASSVVGVGLGLEEKDHQAYIHSVIPGTPAAQPGVKLELRLEGSSEKYQVALNRETFEAP
jgi:Na+-translocating ferredoxin:NAD+ oxidoreductase RnfA subunit